MADQISLVNAFASCPRCGGVGCFALDGETRILCSHCGDGFGFAGQILDFVAGNQKTLLDTIDYDEVYGVKRQIDSYFRFLKERTAPLFDERFESVLEVGAGTGGLSIGMLTGADIGAAMITDISPGMLARCRERVRQFAIDTPILFATNNGECLYARDGAFDLIVAHFCVHHILDYERFLVACYRALRPGGKAVFVEPGLRYFRALCMCALPAVERLAAAPDNWDSPDFKAVLDIHRHMHFTAKYAGDLAVVGEIEDKHVFGRDEFENAAYRAGFGKTRTIPYGVADNPLHALKVYAQQLGASPEFLESFLGEVAADLPGAFLLLDPHEAAASLAFVLEKTAGQPPNPFAPHAYVSPPMPEDALSLRYDIRIDTPKGDSDAFRIHGWIVARRPVRSIRFERASEVVSLPVGVESRPDVYARFADEKIYSASELLHCGFSVDRDAANAPFRSGETIKVAIILDSGQGFEIEPSLGIQEQQTSAIRL